MFHAKSCARKLNFQGNYEGELLNEPSQTNFQSIRASNENDQSEVLCVLSREVTTLQMENFFPAYCQRGYLLARTAYRICTFITESPDVG